MTPETIRTILKQLKKPDKPYDIIVEMSESQMESFYKEATQESLVSSFKVVADTRFNDLTVSIDSETTIYINHSPYNDHFSITLKER